jgi:hypothetical protein
LIRYRTSTPGIVALQLSSGKRKLQAYSPDGVIQLRLCAILCAHHEQVKIFAF